MDKPSVDIGDLPGQCDALLAQAQPGHEIIVTQAGHPRAILTPIPPPPAPPVEPIGWREITVTFLGEPRTIRDPIYPSSPDAKPRVPGLGLGTMTMLPGFDDPLPDEFWLGES